MSPVLHILVSLSLLGVFFAQSAHAQSNDIDALIQQSARLHKQGHYGKAAQAGKRALNLAERRFGNNHLNVGKLLYNLASIYRKQGRSAEAEPLYRRSLAILEKKLGTDPPQVTSMLNTLANINIEQGRFAEAEPLYRRSLAIREKKLGPDHILVAEALNNLASLYRTLGRFSQAEPLHKRSLAIREKKLGPDHILAAESLNNLANLYRSQARFAEAEPLYKRSLSIREKIFGLHHPKVSKALENLANFYEMQGRFAQAEPLHKRSLAIREKKFGPDHISVADALNNLANIHKKAGRFAQAEPLYKRSLMIQEKNLGPDHILVADLLSDLANHYEMQGRFAQAEPLYKRGLAIYEKALGPDHPNFAFILNKLATLNQLQGRFARAEPLYKRSLAILEKVLGPDHPGIGQALNNLAMLYFFQSDWTRATANLRRSADLIAWRTRRDAQSTGQSLTGKKKSEVDRFVVVFRNLIKSAYRLTGGNYKSSAKIGTEMFQVAQLATESAAAASLAKMAARQATGDTQLAILVRERQDLVSEWQRRDAARNAAIAQPASKRNAQKEKKNVARLSAIDSRIAEIDKRLTANFPSFAALANPEPMTIAEVQRHLKINEALVLFLDTPKLNPTPEETFVWVVTKTTSHWVRSPLGPKALKEHVDALRCGLDRVGAWKGSRCFDLLGVVHDQWSDKPLPFHLSRAHKLYKSLFGKVEELIKGKNLLIVPSGPLTQLPFQVLVTEKPKQDRLARGAFTKASWLAKHHAITVLPSVSSLASLRGHAKASRARHPFIGFGNPLLDGDPASAKVARSIQGCAGVGVSRTAQLRKFRSAVLPLGRGARVADQKALRSIAALPETADELCAVARNAGARVGDVHLGKRATETSIKSLSETGTLSKFKVLHFATHGTLAGEMTGSNEPGLILSPPTSATKRDDGYLSSSEVAGLKLDADWVILSACNTAGGQTESAEALSGIAKAFFYAGARSLLVSHWYVDSQATVTLITKAFDALKRDPKIGRAVAMQKAMISLINEGPNTWHPAYWSPFVVVGEGTVPGQVIASLKADQPPTVQPPRGPASVESDRPPKVQRPLIPIPFGGGLLADILASGLSGVGKGVRP